MTCRCGDRTALSCARFHAPPSAGRIREAAVEQVDRDAGRPESMASEPRDDAGFLARRTIMRARFLARHPSPRQLLAAAAAERPKQRRRFFARDAGCR